MDAVALLKAALISLNAAYAADLQANPEGNRDHYSGIGYIIRQIKRTIVERWTAQQALGSDLAAAGPAMSESVKSLEAMFEEAVLTEAGAKYSTATKGAIQSALDALNKLAGDWTATPPEAVSVTDAQAAINDALAGLTEQHDALGKLIEAQRGNTPLTPVITPAVLPESFTLGSDQSWMMEGAVLLGEAAPAANSTVGVARFKMLVIKEGMSHNRVKYPEAVLRESVTKLEGRPIYVDHTEGMASRSLSTKGGWWASPQYEENIPIAGGGTVSGVTATLNVMRNGPVPWLAPMIEDALKAGHPEMVGISILAAGKTKIGRDGSGVYKEAVSIDSYLSADAVAEPGAGGQPIAFAASKGKDQDVALVEGMTLDELKAARADLIEAAKAEAKAEFAAEAEAERVKLEESKKTPIITPPEPETSTVLREANDVLTQMRRQQTSMVADRLLRESRLPKKTKDRILAEIGEQVLAEADITAIIDRYEGVAAEILTEEDSPNRLPLGNMIPFGRQESGGLSPVDKIVASLDHFFGNPNPDLAGKYSKIVSFSEFYRQVTGDHEMTGQYDPSRSVLGPALFQEALPGAAHVIGGATITMSNLLGLSMNRSLVKQYKSQDMWWRDVVDVVDLTNMKQQDRVRLANFGSLTERTTDGAEYTELDWAEVAENYTPTEFGNLVPVGRRAIINDDMRGISRIPRLLAESARITLNEYVANLFTQNSGNGPILADGIQVFNSAGHQGNRLTLAFSRSNAITARTIIRKMTNDAGKRIGLTPRILLGPVELEEDMYQVISTDRVPDSANNAKNLLSSPQGFTKAIAVPQFTDTNNWYLMTDPSELACIEIGFLFGRQEPELMVQDQPTVGMVFTNDVINYKVRWDFGGDWIDYRGAVASIVA